MHGTYNHDADAPQAISGDAAASADTAPADTKVFVTFYSDYAARRLTTDTLTLVDLAERIKNASARKKADLPWLKLARFGNTRTDKGSLRHDANVVEITGIELDYDDGQITIDAALAALHNIGVMALFYTSPSHSSTAPRWRVLAPTSEPLAPAMRAKLAARLNGALKAKLGASKVAATESFTLSQAYYFGWVDDAPKPDHQAVVVNGDYIDQRDDLAEYEALGAKVDAVAKPSDSKPQRDHDQVHGFDAILSRIGDGDGLEGFNGPLSRAAASYVAVHSECLDERKLKKILRETIDKAPKKATAERAESVKRYKSDKYLNGIIGSAIRKFTETLPVTLDHFVADMETHSYIYLPTRKPWPAPSVNARVRPVPLVDAEGRPVLDSKKKPKRIPASEWLDKNRPIEAVTWAPGEQMIVKDRLVAVGGWFDHAGASVLNLYRPPTIVHGDPKQAGPWIDHVRKVYPADAEHIIRWCAYKVQFPQAKINHALLLGGPQGIGKDTILEGLKRAVGAWNFIEVSPQDIAGSQFTGYLQSVVLRISEGHDLGEVNRFAFYEMTKTIIAAPPDVHRVNEKHRPEYYCPNVNGAIITSNYLTNGIYLPPDDRRHYVAWSDLTQGDFEETYFDKLWRWYEDGGDRHVAAYLATLDLSGFDAKAPPKKTEAFYSIANANAAPEEVELVEAIDRLDNPLAVTIKQIAEEADTVPHLQDLAGWITDHKSRRATPHRMAQAGYSPVRNPGDKSGHWKIQGAKQVVYARKELSLHDQIRAVNELIKKIDADAKVRAQAAAEAKERAQAAASAKAKADAEANARTQAAVRERIEARAKSDAAGNAQLREASRIRAEARAIVEAKGWLTSLEQRALELLKLAVNSHGKPPPADKADELPRLVKVVTIEEWRAMCERGGLSSENERAERDRAFWRAKDGLQTANWIACWDDCVWLCRDGG
jgi:hypothetical protein